jgi:cytochrome b subunit of formate dehydrogenase
MVFLVVHWVWRVLWKPAPGWDETRNRAPAGIQRGFDRVQRFFHWATTLALILIVLSGLALYSPAFFDPLSEGFGLPIHRNIIPLVELHVGSVVALGALLALHIGWDFYRKGTWSFISSRRRDLAELSSRARGFLSGGAVPWSEKYDVFMKGFHTTLIMLFLGLGITGLVMYFAAPWWQYPQLLHSAIEPWWMPTPIHDVLGFFFLVLAVAHTYFSLMGTNRPILKAMVIGKSVAPSSIEGAKSEK